MKITRRDSIKAIVSLLGGTVLSTAGGGCRREERALGRVLAQGKIGLVFRERLVGHVTEGIYDFQRGGEKEGAPISFDATVTIDDLGRFYEGPRKVARFEGVLCYKEDFFSIEKGELRFEKDDPDFPEITRLIYQLPCSNGQKSYFLSGFKKLSAYKKPGGIISYMMAFNTLYVHMHRGSLDKPMLGAGIMRIVDVPEFLESLKIKHFRPLKEHFLSYEIKNAPNKKIELQERTKFVKFAGLEPLFRAL